MNELDLYIQKDKIYSPIKLKSEIIQLLTKSYVEDVGFADVKHYKRVKKGYVPSEILPSANTAIVYISLLKKVLEKYGHWYIVSLVNHVSNTNKMLCKFLNRKGYAAKGIGENEYFRDTLIGKISFRQMAVLAGLGSIGKSTMVLHPLYGPRVVMGVVLTNAKIKPSKPFEKNLCTNCGICEFSCPTGAIGEKFDKWLCKNRRKILQNGCGTPCIELCPIGKKLDDTRTIINLLNI